MNGISARSDWISKILQRLQEDYKNKALESTPLRPSSQDKHRERWNKPDGIRLKALEARVITGNESQCLRWALENYPRLRPKSRRALNQLITLLFDWRKRHSLAELARCRPQLVPPNSPPSHDKPHRTVRQMLSRLGL